MRLALESDRPIAHVADDLGIHRETLRKRVRQAEADQGLRPDLPTSEEREEIKRLRQENFEPRRAADISYLRCWEGLVFFAFVLDAYSRMIVGWQLAGHMRTDLVLDALKMTLGQRGPGADVELIHHSDRGSQYTSIEYTQTLADHRVLASVGSVGDAYDNALAESFVDSFKTELITDRVWRTRTQLKLAVVEYIGWYNNARLHESLGDIPPAEYEQAHTDREAITLVGAMM